MKKYEELASRLRTGILQGSPPTGEKLPSLRVLAAREGLSLTTAQHAYDQLEAEGLIEALPRSGYRVLADSEQRARRSRLLQAPEARPLPRPLHDLRSGTLDIDLFEVPVWNRLLRQGLDDPSIVSYGDPQGDPRLRRALAGYAWRQRGFVCLPEEILIASSTQSLLYIAGSLLPGPHVVGMERPHGEMARAFASLGWQVIAPDFEKMDILYLNTACCGPEEKALEAGEARRIIRLAEEHDVLIIEDDYNGELTYRSPGRPALASFARAGRVLYCGSFSRLLLPSVRLSYIVLNPAMKALYEARKGEYAPTAGQLEQLALAAYIEQGLFEKHLRRLRREYRTRSLALEQALQKHWNGSFRLREAYLSYVLEGPELKGTSEIAVSRPKPDGQPLSFASLPAAQAETVVQKLLSSQQEENAAFQAESSVR